MMERVSFQAADFLLQTPAVINADALSLLGYSLGTAALPDIQDYFLDKAFTGNQVRI